MKITQKNHKADPVMIQCSICNKKMGFIQLINGIFYFSDSIAHIRTEIEKDINVFCWNCGKGQKITTKK